MSMPRFPGPYGVVGGRQGSMIGPRTGVVRFTVTGGYVGGGSVDGAAIVVVTMVVGVRVLFTTVVGVGAPVDVIRGETVVGGAVDVAGRGNDDRRGVASTGSAVPISPTTAVTASPKAPAQRLRCW